MHSAKFPYGSVLASVVFCPCRFVSRHLKTREAVAAVHVRSWQSAYRGLVPDAYLDSLSVDGRREAWSRILAETDVPRTGTFILSDGLDVIGFAHVAPTRDDDLAD